MYEIMDEIIIHNQQEMDDIPDNYNGRIIIESKDITVKGNRVVYLYYNANVYLYDNASAVLYDNASAELYDNASAELYCDASAELYCNASAYVRGRSNTYLCDNAIAELYDKSRAYLYNKSRAYLYDNASAELYNRASVELHGNSQVLDKSESHNITLHGNARVVYLPQNIGEYLDYFDVKHTKDMATLYKAVRKTDDGKYVSNHDKGFEYIIGEYKTEKCNTNATQSCTRGIHIAPLDWVLQYGGEWNDLAILEVETNIDDIVLPKNTNGKVRTSKVKVIREVPLEECGALGKMIARKQRKES